MSLKTQIVAYIRRQYGLEADYPWPQYPDYAVFRHRNNQKWFALIMQISANKLGLNGNQKIDIINLKCDPFLISTLSDEPGILPAYHMNKTHWITVRLDSSFPLQKLYPLLDLSYDLTVK